MSESAAGAIQHVHESRWYKILLPLVAPLADPAVKRIMNSPAFQVPSGIRHHLRRTRQTCVITNHAGCGARWIHSCANFGKSCEGRLQRKPVVSRPEDRMDDMGQSCTVAALLSLVALTLCHTLCRLCRQAVKEHLMPITGPETAEQQPCLVCENIA